MIDCIKKSWILEFCSILKQRELNNITWQLPVGTRTETLDEEILKAIHEAGCHSICYAPESGSERSLNIIKKRAKNPRDWVGFSESWAIEFFPAIARSFPKAKFLVLLHIL